MRQYCIDTSSLLQAKFSYPPDTFTSLWDRLDRMIDDGELLAPEDVLRELARKDEDLHAWAKQRPRLFYEIDSALQLEVAAVLASFPRLVDSTRSRSMCDPWIIGLAKVTGRTVVTEERLSTKPEIPRIPDVCDHYGIRRINLLGMIREKGWSF